MTRFAGYAAIFDVPDRGGDIVRKGAFSRALSNAVPLCWQHDRARSIGRIESIAEDARGLRVIGAVDDRVVVVGQGLSFGYRVRSATQRTYRELYEVDLIEISLVTTPMQPLAVVHAIEN